jgi:hypothetical protein
LVVSFVAMTAWPIAKASAQTQPTKGGIEKKDDEGIGKATDPNIPEGKDVKDDSGDDSSSGHEPNPDGDTGDDATGDNPDKANAVTVNDLEGGVHKKMPRATKATYPIEIIERPLTLVAAQAQVTLDVPMVFNTGLAGVAMSQVLHGAYGVTRDVQVGVGYGFGLDNLGAKNMAKAFYAGKAFSIEGAYYAVPGWLAPTIAFDFNGSPFATSVILGAPFRITLHKKFAIIGGDNLFNIRIHKFPVDIDQPILTIGNELRTMTGDTQDTGYLNLHFGGIYQHKSNIAFTGMFGALFPSFSGSPSQHTSLVFSGYWSKNKNLDFSARIGMLNLSDASHSFTFGLFVAYRM